MSNKEPTQEMKKQEIAASSNDLYNPFKDAPPSSLSNTPQAGHLNYISGNNDDIFLARLRQHVGANLEKLINPDETPQQAYERHMQVIGAASRRITNPDQLVKWLENPAHANYYFPEKGFNRVIKNVSDLRVVVDLSTQSARRLIEYVLTDENDSVFARLFCNIEALQTFAANFSRKDVRRVIEEVFVNPDAFEGIFKDELALAKFKKSFPGYANQATNLFMLKRQSLDAIKYLRKRMEEGWGQRAPKVSPSSPDAGSGASSSNAIPTPVAERTLSAANDPTEKASKGQKQKLAVVIPASLFGRSALSGEVSPVIQNLPAANDSKPQENSFDFVFSNENGPAPVLQDFLDGESHKNLSQTSRANRKIYDVETTYKKLLQEENLGPDFARLRNAGETYQAAYQRHLPVIRGLAPINTHAELAHRLATYPDYYYFNRLVSENDFARLFLGDFDDLLNFCHDFPLHTDRILGHVLTYAEIRMEAIYLVALAITFPAYAERFIARVLEDADAFARVTEDADELEALADLPAAYAERFIARVLADADAFDRVFLSVIDLERIVAAFPAYAERIIEQALADADAFARMTPSANSLQHIVTTFPAYAERVIEQVLADADAFAQVTRNADSVEYISHLPAAYAERFLEQVLADTASFAPVTRRAYGLRSIAVLPTAYAERFIERVLTEADAFARATENAYDLESIVNLPAVYAERFLEQILADTAAFARMTGGRNGLKGFLTRVAPNFPEYAKRAEALFVARETARAEVKRSVQPIHVSRTGPLSPTAPAADFEMFSSSASQVVITQQTSLAVNDSKRETKEGPRQSTAKACPPSPDTNVSLSSSSVDQVTITVQASPAVNEAKEEMSGGQKPKLAVAIPASLFGKPQLLENLSPVIQKPPAANEVSNHDLENQSESPKKGCCCWIL
jgi:hypothetical protein